MIIVNQNKKNISNFDKVNYIEILPSSNTDGFKIIVNYDTDYEVLGFYKTEERAKEVLQEIIKFYEILKRYECSSNNGLTLFTKDTFVYEMPLE